MKLKLIIISLALLLLSGPVGATETGWSGLNPNLGSGTFVNGVLVVAPSASVAGSTYHSSQSVVLSAAGSNSIRYTTNGSDPACPATGTLYTGAVTVNSNLTLKAVSCYKSDNSFPSTIASYTYAFTCSTSSVSNGTVSSYPSCDITCNSGYTLSGSSCIASGGGGGGGGGGYIAPTTVSANGSTGVTMPLTVTNTQTGTLSQPLATSGTKVELTVPTGAVSGSTTFTASAGSLTSDLTPANTTGAFMVGSTVFNITAVSNGSSVRNFSGNLSITLTVPDLPAETTNLGVYYFNDTTKTWTLVPGASFDAVNGKVTFQVNHLTKFAIMKVTGTPATLAVTATSGTPTPTNGAKSPSIETPAAGSPDYTSIVAKAKALVKKVSAALTNRLAGQILLQVEQKGEAWYVNPLDKLKYYLGRPADAFNLMRKLGLGISEKTYASFSKTAPARLAGRILLRVASHGEAYYVNPVTLKLHYLGRPADAFAIMRQLGLGITDGNLNQISVGEVK